MTLFVTGKVDITNVTPAFAAGHSTATQFTLIQNDGFESIIGTFVGIPEGQIVTFNSASASIT